MTRLYGEGTIKELIKGKKYFLRLYCGIDPITGKYREKTEMVHGTKAQARRRLEEIRTEIESGLRMNADKITYAELSEQFHGMRELEGVLKPQTLRSSRMLEKHIVGRIGSARVCDLDAQSVRNLYRLLLENGIGNTTLHHVHKQLKQILQFAVNNDILLKNPCDRVKAPQRSKPVRKSLTKPEAARLREVLLEAPDSPQIGVLLGLSTGMRVSEVMGLTWRNVTFDGSSPCARVIQSLDRFGNIQTPKTDSGIRTISIDGKTREALRVWKKKQALEMFALGMRQEDSTPVCTNQLYGFFDLADYSRWFRAFCVQNKFGRYVDDEGEPIPERHLNTQGFPVDREGHPYSRNNPKPKTRKHYEGLKFHELRHTQATLQLAAGVDIKTVQTRLGHASASVTLNTYAHALPERDRAAADLFESILDEAEQPRVIEFKSKAV